MAAGTRSAVDLDVPARGDSKGSKKWRQLVLNQCTKPRDRCRTEDDGSELVRSQGWFLDHADRQDPAVEFFVARHWCHAMDKGPFYCLHEVV